MAASLACLLSVESPLNMLYLAQLAVAALGGVLKGRGVYRGSLSSLLKSLLL